MTKKELLDTIQNLLDLKSYGLTVDEEEQLRRLQFQLREGRYDP